MNRFYDIPSIQSRELLPWEAKRRGLSVTTGLFELIAQEQRVRLRSDIAGGDLVLDVGEVSDLASIPSVVQWFVMDCDDQRIAAGAWFHDKLFKAGGVVSVYWPDGSIKGTVRLTFEQCNKILCDEAMPDLGASAFARWKVATGLAIGGRGSFQKPNGT
jgi:hypothetical protein